MSRPPEQIEDFRGQRVEFWFGDEPLARCGNVTIELHHHPHLAPKAPYRLEPFGTSLGGNSWHYSGQEFEERLTDADFVRHTMKMLETLRKRGDWYPTKIAVALSR